MLRRLAIPALALLLAACAAVPAAAAPVYRGRLVVRHADDFAHGRSQTTWTLRMHGRRLPLLPTRPTNLRSGSAVTVRGHRLGRFLEGAVRRRGGALVHAASALGSHSVAVVLLNFAADTRQPWSPATVAQRFFTDSNSTAAFYAEESYGGITLHGDVFGWYTIPASNSTCDVDTWASQARAAALADGRDLSSYDHVVFVFPQQSSCGWAGLGEMPGSQTWLNGDISVRVAAHELGHNMGLHHASSYTCTSGGVQITFSSTCSASEYGDPFDVMGQNARHSNAWHLQQLGVLSGGDVQTVSASGTYTLRSAISKASGAALLRVPAGGSPARWFDVSLRQPGGVFDNYALTDPVVNGLTITYDPSPTSSTQSLLLDATPGVGGFTDSALAQGRTFASGTVSITATQVSGGSATVDVVLGTTADTQPPSAPTGLTATPARGSVALSWNAATDNVGVVGYRVLRDGALAATTPLRTFTDANLAGGSTHTYQVAAYDAAGNATPSAVAVATVPADPVVTPPPPPTSTPPPPPPPPGDTIGPVVRIASPRGGARLRRTASILAAATDNVGVVRTTLSIDGVQVASAAGGRISRRWSLRGVRSGSHLILVRAFDAAGNFGTRVVRVEVVGVRSARAARRRAAARSRR